MKLGAKRVQAVKRAYRRTHLHLERMVEGLTDDHLQTSLQPTGESISRLLQHILNAEAYWLEKVHEPRPEFCKRPDLASSRSALKELELGYLDMLGRRGREVEPQPTPAWIALRVSQHGLYHAAQIALLRRLLGVPAVPVGQPAPLTWETAVDELTALAIESFGERSRD